MIVATYHLSAQLRIVNIAGLTPMPLPIINALGIDLVDWDYKSNEMDKDKRAKEDDLRASASLQAWIENGCKNLPKKPAKRK